MGWFVISEPGSVDHNGHPWGPCAEVCEHADCVATRRDADSLCTICGGAIGYMVKAYAADERGRYDHAVCVWTGTGPVARLDPAR